MARLDTTRHVRHDERVETSVSNRDVRQARHSQNAWVRHVERVVSCRDVTWRVKWNLDLSHLLLSRRATDITYCQAQRCNVIGRL